MINGQESIDRLLAAIETIGLPAAYFTFDKKVNPPFLVYYGSGQIKMSADDTHFWHNNNFNIEYYFKDKNVKNEEELERALLEYGFQFSKSEDIYLSDEDVFVIYYYL